jgi:hypothetical protein
MLLVAQELEALLIAVGIKLWSTYMCAVDALQTRLAQIPIFKTLRLQLGTIGEGTPA